MCCSALLLYVMAQKEIEVVRNTSDELKALNESMLRKLQKVIFLSEFEASNATVVGFYVGKRCLLKPA